MKRFLSFMLTLSIIFTAVFCLDLTAFAFSPRLSSPAKSGWYADYTRNNCVAYARCRANEILGRTVDWSSGDGGAGFWKTSGFSHGSTPKVGSIACWSGHCAIVESVSGTNIVLSEAHYSYQPTEGGSYKNIVIDGGGGTAGTWFDNYYGAVLDGGKPSECTSQTWYGYVYLLDDASLLDCSKYGHDDGEWIVTQNATYTKSGVKERRCTRCGEVLEKATVPKLIRNGWFTVNGNKYYYRNDVMQTSWRTVNNRYGDPYRYFFGTDGVMRTGWQTINNRYGDPYKYYFGDNGYMRTGWQTINNRYGDPYRYYFGSNGYMRTGWQWIENSRGVKYRYYFGTNGYMRTGWQKLKASNGNYYWYYFYSNGVNAIDTSVRKGSKTYYFNKYGICTNP